MRLTVFITGASSGIGEYLAYHYARQGCIIGCFARRESLLFEIQVKCKDLGGTVVVYPGDTSNEIQVKSAIEDFASQQGRLDIVYANAGIGGADPIWKGETKGIHHILNVNIHGVVNTVYHAVPIMIKQQSGMIGVVSSVAAFKGLPRHGTYSGSKAAIRKMVDGWRYDLIRNNIQITTIHPGFIDTPMVKNNKFMPFLMDVETAVIKIVKAMESGRKSYIFPWQWRWVIPLMKIVPDWVINAIYLGKIKK